MASSSCHRYLSVTPLFSTKLHFSSPRRTSLPVNRRSISVSATMASPTKKVRRSVIFTSLSILSNFSWWLFFVRALGFDPRRAWYWAVRSGGDDRCAAARRRGCNGGLRGESGWSWCMPWDQDCRRYASLWCHRLCFRPYYAPCNVSDLWIHFVNT